LEIVHQNDEPRLQTSFENYESCSSISKISADLNHENIELFHKIEHVDECTTADEIYQCGLAKEPAATVSLVKTNTENKTVVRF
jgi:hypothetical protein